jgi:hypothetical protein
MCNLVYLEEGRRIEQRDYFGYNRFFLHQKHVAFQMAHVQCVKEIIKLINLIKNQIMII